MIYAIIGRLVVIGAGVVAAGYGATFLWIFAALYGNRAGWW